MRAALSMGKSWVRFPIKDNGKGYSHTKASKAPYCPTSFSGP
jgi:hypothetical protein